MSVSQASVGTLYQPLWNGIAWSQPGGQGTTVYPQEENAPFNPPQNPIPPGLWFSESMGLWFAGCGHNYNAARLFFDYDETTQMSACLVCCGVCTYIQSIIEPAESFSDTNLYPIIVS